MVAFVLGDIFSSRGGGNSPADQYVGEVYGEEINLLEYEKRVEAQKEAMASIGQPVSGAQERQIRNQVWNRMVQERIMYRELNELGMRIGQDEYDDIRFGENVRSEFANDQNFQDPETGQFDPTLVQNYFAFLSKQYPLFYKSQTNRIVNDRLYEKYNNLIREGIYVNTLEAKDEYYRQEQSVKFSFVTKPYTSIPDSTVEVSESELRDYYNEHKDEKRFERDASVDVRYLVWSVEPTEADEAEIKEEIASLVPDFKDAKKDSSFVLKFSDTKNAVPVDLSTQNNDELDSLIQEADSGDVIGPYKNGNRFAIAKITEVGTKEEATSRHILLSKSTEPDVDVLLNRADSIKRVIQRKGNFEEMVTQFSEDPGSKDKGGVYEWFDRERMVPEFTEASFDKPIGSLNVVETTYGVHLVEPLEKRDVKVVKAYVVNQDIEPSNETFSKIYNEANEFAINAGDLEGFMANAESEGLEVKEGNELSAQTRNLPGVTGSSEALRWAHNKDVSEKGQLSEVYEFDTKIVVLGLKERRDSGVKSFEESKEEIEPDVILNKKKEILKGEMNGKSLEDLETELDLSIKVASNVTEKKPNLPGGANEPYIVGYAITLSEGDVSPALDGNKGVYVIRIENKETVEPREEYLTYKDELDESRTNAMQNYASAVYRALRDAADVKDERSTY